MCGWRSFRPIDARIGEHGSIAVIERLILTLKQSIAWLTLVKGKPGVRLTSEITLEGGRRHLPIVTLRRAA